MAQFDFLGTWDDSWAILRAVLEPGDVRLIPDLYYEHPKPLIITKAEEDQLKDSLEGRRRVYIWSPLFSTQAPYFWRIEAGANQGGYLVDVRKGGPLLDLSLPACYRIGSGGEPAHAFDGGPGLHLAPGMLSYQREYQDVATGNWKATPEVVKSGYREIMRRMKQQLVRHEFHKPIWIGTDALREVEYNDATIHGFGLPS